LAAYERYSHDLVTLGVDIYNLEAEALGAEVGYYDSIDIPGIKEPILHDPRQLREWSIPDPGKDGRLPMFIEAGSRVKAALQGKVLVGGSVCGPFTLACILRGIDHFLLDSIRNPAFFVDTLRFCNDVAQVYGKALISAGLGLSINESFCNQPFISPNTYARLVLPIHQKMIRSFKDMGMKNVGLIIGGDTLAMAPHLLRTGTSILIADYNTDHAAFKKAAIEAQVAVRGNVDPKLLEFGGEAELRPAAQKVIDACKQGGRFMLGTGVVPYHAKPENLDFLSDLTKTKGSYE
jgi:uroporphyrinogen decarboxylase